MPLAAALRPLIHFCADHHLCVCLLGLNATFNETTEGNTLEIYEINFFELRMKEKQMVDVFASLQQLIVSQRSQKPHVFLGKIKVLKWVRNAGDEGKAEGLM